MTRFGWEEEVREGTGRRRRRRRRRSGENIGAV